MTELTSCCLEVTARVGILFNLPGVHVLEVIWRERPRRIAGLGLLVETDLAETGCPGCGVTATGHGHRHYRRRAGHRKDPEVQQFSVDPTT